MIKKLLILLVAVVIGAFMASGAIALEYGDIAYDVTFNAAGTVLNPEGKGDALIAPYFDVRVVNGQTQDTLFAIINENTLGVTWAGVAAKLRFREWDKSEEVFDIDIWLSDNDVWVGQLTRNSSNGLTTLISPDYVITADSATEFTISKTTTVSTGIDFFTTYAPGGLLNTKAPPTGFTAADLTNMGYFEVIGEERTYSKPYTTTAPIKVTRLATGYDCPNTLSAYVYIVRVADGVALGYDAAAIANFYRTDFVLYSGPGGPAPDLSYCEDGLDQLEFQISKAKVYAGYSIEDAIDGAFSLVVTFPTKFFHFDPFPNYTIIDTTTYGPPFTGLTANYGEVVDVNIFDRLEAPYSPEAGFWSPRLTPTISLPWEVNIVGLYVSPPTVPVLGNRNNVAFTTGGFQSGWIWIDLYNGVHSATYYTSGTGFDLMDIVFTSYNGMPALSLALQEFSNGAVGGYYGAIFPAFYAVDFVY